MSRHSLVSPPCHTAVISIAQLTRSSSSLNVTGHHAGKPVSGVFGQDSSLSRELYRSVDGFASAKELNPTPKTMERPHVAAGEPTRVDQCRTPGGEESSLGGVFAGPSGVDAVSVLGDGECAGPVAGAAEREREVKRKKPDPRLTDPRYCLFRWFIADSYGITPEAYARAELAKEFRIANHCRRNGKMTDASRWALSRANRQLWAARNQDAIQGAAA